MCPFTVRFTKPGLGIISRHPDCVRFDSTFSPLAVTAPLGASFGPPLNRSPLGQGLPSPCRTSPHASSHQNLVSIGLFTDFPSTTAFALALGADLPRADCLYAGNLRFSADGDPTRLFVTYACILSSASSRTPRGYPFAGQRNAPLPVMPHGMNPGLRYHA